MSRRAAIRGLTLSLATLPLLNACAFACGTERWAVKTLTDSQHHQITAQSQSTTIASLIAIPAPTSQQLHSHATSRLPTELHTYTVRATLLRWHHEADEDFHLVLSDANGRTMIAEIPAPDCVSDAQFAKALTTMRARVSPLKVPAAITIRGVAFFDFKHHQDGLAPNAIELHPVLGFRVQVQ